jgi:hypothetical protein
MRGSRSYGISVGQDVEEALAQFDDRSHVLGQVRVPREPSDQTLLVHSVNAIILIVSRDDVDIPIVEESAQISETLDLCGVSLPFAWVNLHALLHIERPE